MEKLRELEEKLAKDMEEGKKRYAEFQKWACKWLSPKDLNNMKMFRMLDTLSQEKEEDTSPERGKQLDGILTYPPATLLELSCTQSSKFDMFDLCALT